MSGYKMMEFRNLNRTGKDAINELFPGILKFKETKTTYTEANWHTPTRIEGSDDFLIQFVSIQGAFIDSIGNTTSEGLGVVVNELREEGIEVEHYLFADAYHTWWTQGKGYLCRIIDMMHSGLLDEVFFGKEVIDGWPPVVSGWPSTMELIGS